MFRSLLFSICGCGKLAAATVTLLPFQDATLFEDPAGSLSGGGANAMHVGRVGTNDATPLRRGLLQFDLSSIPAGSTIHSVQLTVTVVQVKSPTAQVVSLHRMMSAWVAGNQVSNTGNGVAAAPGDATWLHRTSPTTWTNPGGDFISGSSASTSVAGLGEYSWTGAGLVADVTGWLANPSSNSGWAMLGNETVSQSVKVIGSMQNTTASSRPRLLVNFTPVPEPHVALLSVTGLAALLKRRRA
jgi:hypothetical protein